MKFKIPFTTGELDKIKKRSKYFISKIRYKRDTNLEKNLKNSNVDITREEYLGICIHEFVVHFSVLLVLVTIGLGVIRLGYFYLFGPLIAFVFSPTPSFLRILGISTVAGLLGSLFDSYLGASIQAIYYCPACDKETEQHPFHQCDVKTHQIRGYHWLNNDMVNFLASLFGSGIIIILSTLLF